jgi:hypothetical protein
VTRVNLRLYRYVLERMHMSAITARLRAILEKDWKSEAAELLAERIAVGESPVCLLTYLLLIST